MKNFPWPFFVALALNLTVGACATQPGKPPRMEFSAQAMTNLRVFEADRAQVCFHVEDRIRETGFPMGDIKRFIPDSWSDDPEKLAAARELQGTHNALCDIDQISFVASEIGKTCSDPAAFEYEICETFRQWQADPKGAYEPIFPDSIETLLAAKMYNPWQIVDFVQGLTPMAGVTHLQQGNVFIEMRILLGEFAKARLGAVAYQQVLMSLVEMGFLIEDADHYYIPVLDVMVVLAGTSTGPFDLEVAYETSDGELLPFKEYFGERIPYPETGYIRMSGILSQVLMKRIKESTSIVFRASDPVAPPAPLFAFRFSNNNAAKVLDEMVTHYRALAADPHNASKP